ncbi:MAG: PilZ domain-containing protein [Proteobacteria bacterium]|nr:PilZ domain-containing protein [Pseudomonadota bacterium]
MDASKRPTLREGMAIGIHPDETGAGDRVMVTVEQVDGDLVWIKGNEEGLRAGDFVLLEHPIRGDARYLAPAEIELQSPERFALRPVGGWERHQERAYVRISIHSLSVRVGRVSGAARGEGEVEADAPTDVPTPSWPMLDLSAGGMRFEANDTFEPGEPIVCHFELPGEACFALPAQVVRVEAGRLQRTPRRRVAVRFEGVDESNKSALLRWVFREQVRRHRLRKRSAPV